jgi:ribonuclease HI
MAPPPFNSLVGRIRDERRLHNTAWAASYEYLHSQHRKRIRRVYNQITCYGRRIFAGTALPDTSGEGLGDVQVFKSMGYLRPGTTSVYYSDGSHRNLEEALDGLMASAVAYRDGNDWMSETATPPRHSGETHDAELYAIKMAFDIAIRHSTDPYRSSENVVIFVDRDDIIRMMAGEENCICAIGPVPFDGEWALSSIYNAAERLREAGKKVVVAWMKGHKKGAGRNGNHEADAAATAAMKTLIRDEYKKSPMKDLPDWVTSFDGDARHEALWRLSKPFFRWGTGICWVAPSLQYEPDTEALMEEEEDDWTLHRPIMTLRGAQEEDTRELKRYFVEQHLESRPFLPQREATQRKKVAKAIPMKHLWSQTTALPKPPKMIDYGKLYRKGRERREGTSNLGR